jgi:hypothetical protein
MSGKRRDFADGLWNIRLRGGDSLQLNVVAETRSVVSGFVKNFFPGRRWRFKRPGVDAFIRLHKDAIEISFREKESKKNHAETENTEQTENLLLQ